MTAVFNLTSTSSDLLYYLEEVWSAGFSYNGNGAFDDPNNTTHANWGAGTTSGYGVVLEGSPLDYAQGGLNTTTSDIDLLQFGTGYSYDETNGSALTTVDLSIDLGGVAPTTTFNYAIYTLSHGGLLEGGTFFGQSLPGFYDYFAQVGTEQIGTSGADALYSFEGNDVLTGNGGIDEFVFDLAGFGLLDTAFTTIGDDTITDFNAANETIYIGVTGYDDYSDLSITGTTNAVIDLGSYGSITLTGVSASSLSADNFAFV
ncbi:hemolysin [Agrobacterium vitis]|uniref:Hemolysin n=1 Tax=Agrobacterium vitis TaxID=373 RepID=A0AAE2RG43_AGRVI|nr:hemolysin [Agrobacterium vitis]MBF2717688.1 hemolysin [Agrobacterium vitis]MVA22629.1 hemolysin [Agrobacterium vitis]